MDALADGGFLARLGFVCFPFTESQPVSLKERRKEKDKDRKRDKEKEKDGEGSGCSDKRQTNRIPVAQCRPFPFFGGRVPLQSQPAKKDAVLFPWPLGIWQNCFRQSAAFLHLLALPNLGTRVFCAPWGCFKESIRGIRSEAHTELSTLGLPSIRLRSFRVCFRLA